MATDRLHLLLYRALLLTTAAVALVLGITAGLDAPTITPQYQLTEYWRAYGLLVFAALAAYLGATPPGAAILWVVVIFHKLSMTMTAVLLLRHGVAGAPVSAFVDGLLVLATLIALGLRAPAARASRVTRAERAEFAARSHADRASADRPQADRRQPAAGGAALTSGPLPTVAPSAA